MTIGKFIFSTIGFCFGLLACDSPCTDTSRFNYNQKSGKCENCNGAQGFNIFDIGKVRNTKNAECLDLSGQNLVYLLDTSEIEDFNEVGYNILTGFNFRGSKFDNAILRFNHIHEADFSGADLRNLEYGYADITGRKDQYTFLPLVGDCSIKGDSLGCAF